LCLFSFDVLRQKVAEAKEVVELVSANDEHEEPSDTALPTPVTPHAQKASISSLSSIQVPVEPPTVADPQSQLAPLSSTSAPTYTIASLARLPASEIIKIANSPSSLTGIPLPKADPEVVRQTDEFIDSLRNHSSSGQKQALGERLFKFIKGHMSSKNAGKITIALLDTEDLRSLAHLVESYPSVLKEKATLTANAIAGK